MRLLRILRLRLRSLLLRRQVESELDEELRFHVESMAERNRASGMDREQARARALRDIGSLTSWKEQCRDQRGLNPLDSLFRDVRYAVRVAGRNRFFSLLVVVSLALGIAGVSAVFSVAYAMLIDPFPYRDAQSISLVTFNLHGAPSTPLLYPMADYRQIANAATLLQESFAFKRISVTSTRGATQPVVQIGFSPGAFSFLGVPMLKGRGFGPPDIPSPDAPPAFAVLSHSFWQHHFGGSDDIIGKTLELDHQLYTVIGVAPPRFTWGGGDVFVPLKPSAGGGPEVDIVVRARAGISLSAVSGQIDSLTHRAAAVNPQLYPRGFFRMRAIGMADQTLGNARQTLIVLSSASAFLLLIACANVAILLFARAATRQREMAVRVSMGASAGQVLRQLLIEAVGLSLAGGAAGLLLASTALRIVLILLPLGAIPPELTIEMNGPIVLATFALCVLTGTLFGLLPALELSRPAVYRSMQEGGLASTGKRNSGRSRGLLIAAEVSLTVLLMAGSAITMQTLIALHSVRLGYDPANVVGIAIHLPEGGYRTWNARAALFERVLSGLGSVRGVQFAAATGDAVPPWTGFPAAFEIEGQHERADRSIQIGLVGGDYFPALRIPLLRGRLLTADEMRLASPVAVINDEMAHRYRSEGRDPIGARIHVPALRFSNNVVMTPPDRDQWFQVVGVVGTALNEGLRQPASPSMYVSYKLALTANCNFLMRTESDPHALIHAIGERIHEIEPDIPTGQPLTLEEQLSSFDRALPRFLAALFGLFGTVALTLAATGLYSVVSYGVERRTRELGIRIALGATHPEVLSLVLSSTARYVCGGILFGLLAGVASTRVVALYLPDWTALSALPFAAVVAAFIPVGGLAAWLPARRAVRIAPTVALRHE